MNGPEVKIRLSRCGGGAYLSLLNQKGHNLQFPSGDTADALRRENNPK